MRDGEGQVIGIEHDILKAVGEKEGFNIVIHTQPWKESIFDTLNTGKSDFIGSGVIITDERKQKEDFTDPIALTQMVAVVPSQSPIQDFSELKNDKIAVQLNAMAGTMLKQYLNGQTDNLIAYDSSYLAFAGLVTGKAQAAFGEEGVMRYQIQNYMHENPNAETFRIIPLPGVGKREIAFAVKKGRDDLRLKFNRGLKAIKADGTYQKIMEEWMGKNNPNTALY